MKIPFWLPLLLGVLIAVGSVSTDMYLPAFPAIEAALHGRPGAAQITLAAWFAGLAIGQITQGTLTDRFGRRAPLIAGTALYTLATIGCALSRDFPTLTFCRFAAAIGGSASMVVPRAIVRDLADGHAAARLISRQVLVMGVAPILAPTLGGIALTFAGWQAIFWICAFYGALCGVLVVVLVPETLPRERRVRDNATRLVSRYASIATEPSFLANALAGGGSMFAFFAYISGSPGVFEQIYRLSPAAYGALFGACACGMIVCSQINPPLVRRFGPGAVLRGGVRAMLAADVLMLILAFSHIGFWEILALPIFVTTACGAFIMANSTVGALSRHAGHAGSATALMGTMQFFLGATSGLVVGLAADGTARPMAVLMLAGGLLAFVCDLWRGRIDRRRA